ncbi:MAG: transcriptional repressor [Asticcacaulis sp.]
MYRKRHAHDRSAPRGGARPVGRRGPSRRRRSCITAPPAVDPHISLATVYRTVRLFEEAGVVERHDFGDGRSRYEQAGDDHHDHLINIKTGEVVEFFDQEIETMKEALAEKLGLQAGRPQSSNCTACRWKTRNNPEAGS